MFVSKTLRCLKQVSRIYTRSGNSSSSVLRSSSLFVSNNSRFKFFSSESGSSKAEIVTIYFKLPNGQSKTTKAKVGSTLLDVVLDNNVGLDGFGACEGTLACSTCHLVFAPEIYKNLPNKPMDEELDMLDLAYGLTDTSRLGCQIIVTKDMDGLEVEVPEGVADARS